MNKQRNSPIKRITVNVLTVILFYMLSVQSGFAQTPTEKNIKTQYQTWISINNVFRLSDHWGAIADFHVRRNNGVSDPSFYFVRFGAQYWIKEHFTGTAGYAHMWLAPTTPGWSTFSNEDRIYQQIQANIKSNTTGILLRLRNEQRKVELMQGDSFSGNYRFTDRVRFLISITQPIFKNPNLPKLLIADEVLINFGKDVVFNTFDQNRFTLGIRQTINKQWSFDFGYMAVYQQKSTGVDYDLNHTLRLFFYTDFNFRKADKNYDYHDMNSGEE